MGQYIRSRDSKVTEDTVQQSVSQNCLLHGSKIPCTLSSFFGLDVETPNSGHCSLEPPSCPYSPLPALGCVQAFLNEWVSRWYRW